MEFSTYVKRLRVLYKDKKFITIEYLDDLLLNGGLSQEEYNYIIA